MPQPFDNTQGPHLEWEALLLEPLDEVEESMTPAERVAHREAQLAEWDNEREESIRYATENGYEIDTYTGQYLSPES